MPYGDFNEDTIVSMMRDYIYHGKSMKEIADHYKIARMTVSRIAKRYNWKGRKQYRDEQLEKQGTIKRASTASKIVGRMMRIVDKHSIELEMMAFGKHPGNIISDDVIQKAYIAMGSMDRIAKILKEAKETMTPEELIVTAPDLEWSKIEERYKSNTDRGRKQLEEWQEDRNPAIKEKEKEHEEKNTIETEKVEKKKIKFEGIDEDQQNSIGVLSD